MNIFAIEGHKVRCFTFTAGYEYDRQWAKEYLEIGGSYTVDHTIIHSSSTDVYLKEFPHINFNSVFFEDVVEQSSEDNMKHIDWYRYNR